MTHLVDNRPVGNRRTFGASWSLSSWAEEVCADLLCDDDTMALPYGFSDDLGPLATKDQKDAYANLYAQTETLGKRPDLLTFTRSNYNSLVKKFGRKLMHNLHRTPDIQVPQEIFTRASSAIEIEFSSGEGEIMMGLSTTLKKAKHAQHQGIALTKDSLCTWIKKDDLTLLKNWQGHTEVPLFFVQFYSDGANRVFALTDIERELKIKNGLIQTKRHRYSSTEKIKTLYLVPYTLGREFASVTEKPLCAAERIVFPTGRSRAVETICGGEFSVHAYAKKLATGQIQPEKTVEIQQAKTAASCTGELDQMLEKGFFKKRGTTGPEIYQKLSRYDQTTVRAALQELVDDGTLAKTQKNSLTCYLPTE